MASVKKFVVATFFEYETQKVIAISSYKIGLIYRSIQLLIVTYVVGWVMLREKGYQSFDSVVSGVTTKLKGLEYTNYTNIPSVGDRIWDVADWAIPPQMNSAFFVTTNVVITKNQSQTNCEEDKDNKWHANCTTDSDCVRGEVHLLGWGVRTGRCVNSTREANLRICEIYGWCPTEQDRLPLGKDKVLMTRVKNFTVLIKNSVEFPKFKVKRRNIPSTMTDSYLKKCFYNPESEKDKHCPIFRLGDIIKYGQSISHKAAKQIWITGGMVAIDIHWECNFDYHEDYCNPEYKFRSLEDGKVGQGWNFRHAYHYEENGIHRRTLVKAFGIQFFISVTGRGGKFDVLNFTMNMGSGLALLTLATVLCDIIVLNIMRKRKKYRQAKIDKVKRREIERAKTLTDSGRVPPPPGAGYQKKKAAAAKAGHASRLQGKEKRRPRKPFNAERDRTSSTVGDVEITDGSNNGIPMEHQQQQQQQQQQYLSVEPFKPKGSLSSFPYMTSSQIDSTDDLESDNSSSDAGSLQGSESKDSSSGAACQFPTRVTITLPTKADIGCRAPDTQG